MKFCVSLLALSLVFSARAQVPGKRDPFRFITAAIEQGRLPEAEKALRGILQTSPENLTP